MTNPNRDPFAYVRRTYERRGAFLIVRGIIAALGRLIGIL